MNRSKAAGGFCAGASLLLLALGAAPVARAQSVDTSQPISVRPAPKAKKKFDKFSGQILAVDSKSIQVRGNGNYDVRRFEYSPKLSEKIARGLPRGRYAKGQPVLIKYVAGSDVATGIRR